MTENVIFKAHRCEGRVFLVIHKESGSVDIIDDKGAYYGAWLGWDSFRSFYRKDRSFIDCPIRCARVGISG